MARRRNSRGTHAALPSRLSFSPDQRKSKTKAPTAPRGRGAPVRSPVRSPARAPVVEVSSAGPWQAAVTKTVEGLGYELVDLERAARGLLRVTIDRVPGRIYGPPGAPQPGEFITVEDCEAVTRQLQYLLEVEGVDYGRLEVSSPGLDRPLRSEADCARFAGQAVRITLREPFEGRKNWEGVLAAAPEGGGWTLSFMNGKAEQQLGFQWAEVREARLVPVVNFKGRAAQAAPAPTAAATAPAAAQNDERQDDR
jgi:ribosome maturation factor RimP